MSKNILIIGGTSGLGLALAERYIHEGHRVVVAGRKNLKRSGLEFVPFSIGSDTVQLRVDVDALVARVGSINTIVYAAGFYQEGRIDELGEEEILKMLNVGLTAPLFLIRGFKESTGKPLEIVLITSSSQFTPREKEPVYTAVKAGLGMLGDSLALDPRIGKVLVVAPAGMRTPFWKKEKDISTYLDPEWVAEEVIKLSSGPFKYRFAKILRDPPKVEIVETRQLPD